ncbi:tRNA nucleotidyltransferase/poly(A) polymerase family protein [Deinococcus radiophilus]|uniref:CCA tRNA nucleotidyltransferase n=1 Tax=Deinococcus radiophilus TaxID=32062 RepID=A0A431VN60_9DEIO|nr:CCA tRNA nucleotidyltransferase [Deinococcus radiophilus]RTR23823.1 CCA tRNA nucleotidyltransferase [Deinococcus radiophilus]UFA50461.1 CCA tRNA nucleotidyltransferase [Deinococcus radiophilus]
MDHRAPALSPETAAQQVRQALPDADRDFLAGLVVDAAGAPLALVGGAVRDALLGVPDATPDLDIVLDTRHGADLGTVAQRYSARTGQPHLFYPEFQNASLSLPDGRHADLIRARHEHYPVAGQRPEAQPGSLQEDLQRRDFGVNALALTLCGPLALLDPCGGLADLQARQLRPLHSQSFYEDASRLVRAARLAGRLGLDAHPELLRQVPDALVMALHTPRLWAELGLLLHEPNPAQAAAMLRDWGAGQLLPPGTEELWRQLYAAGTDQASYAAALLHMAPEPQPWQERLALGTGPARLLERALSHDVFPTGSPEAILRRTLLPERPDYPALQGRDLLTAGWSPGPTLGQALSYLQGLRERGQVSSQAEEWAALHEWQARPESGNRN